jgi:hypothetical protein
MAKPDPENRSRPPQSSDAPAPENRTDLSDHARIAPETESREDQMDEDDRRTTR